MENAEAIFSEAIRIPSAAQRNAFVDQACGDDASLRAEVDRLLQAHWDAGSLFDQSDSDSRPPAETVAIGATDDTAEASQHFPSKPSWLDLEPCATPGRIGKLGDYEISHVIGQGGMGSVMKAWDTKLHREVAVKVMSPELASNSIASQRFLREAQSAAAVTHKHVVTIYAIKDAMQPPLLAMEFVEGETLQQRIASQGTLPAGEIVRISRETAEGLAAAHALGLIHRDIKPGNILLEQITGRVKIADFGLARAVETSELTQTGMVLGTPQYMSPEQARGDSVDARSDLFSLGSVMYAMCTGQAAFQSETTVGMLQQVCNQNPQSIAELNPDIPHSLERIIDRLLRKNPDERYQTGDELAEALRSVSDGSVNRARDPSADWPHRKTAMVACGVLLLLVTGFAIATGLLRGTSPVEEASGLSGVEMAELWDSPNARWSQPVLVSAIANEDFNNGLHLSEDCRFLFTGLWNGARQTELCRFRISDESPGQLLDRTWLEGELSSPDKERSICTFLDGEYGFFCSDRSNEEKKDDLWFCRRDAAGSYGQCQIAGNEINSTDRKIGETAPTITADGLLLVFCRWGDKGFQLWTTSRDHVDQPFAQATLMPVSDLFINLDTPTLSHDGLLLTFMGRDHPDQSADLFYMTRNSRDQAFGRPRRFGDMINSPSEEKGIGFTPDGRTLYFGSADNPTGKLRLCVSRLLTEPDQPTAKDNVETEPVSVEPASVEPTEEIAIAAQPIATVPTRIQPPGSSSTERSDTDLTTAQLLTSSDYEWTVPETLVFAADNQPHDACAPFVSPSGKELFFESYNGLTGSRDLFVCDLSPDGLFWTAPRPLPGPVNTRQHEGGPSIADDGKLLVFDNSGREGLGGSDLWMARRQTSDEPFGEPVSLGPSVNSTGLDSHPHISNDGLTLVFCTVGREESNGWDIYLATRRGLDEPFGKATPLANVNSDKNEQHSSLSADGTVLLFDGQSEGKRRLFISTRASTDDDFDLPIRLSHVFEDSREVRDAFLTADGQTLYYASRGNKPGTTLRLKVSHHVRKADAK